MIRCTIRVQPLNLHEATERHTLPGLVPGSGPITVFLVMLGHGVCSPREGFLVTCRGNNGLEVTSQAHSLHKLVLPGEYLLGARGGGR